MIELTETVILQILDAEKNLFQLVSRVFLMQIIRDGGRSRVSFLLSLSFRFGLDMDVYLDDLEGESMA